MTKIKTGRYFLLLLLTFIVGCNYSPEGEHIVEIDSEGTIPEIEVELNFNTDTIYISRNERVQFKYTKNGNKVNWAKFIVNGKETPLQEEKEGGFEFEWYFPNFNHGTYTLTMIVFTKSGTGSIADLVGAEGYLFEHSWTVIVTDASALAPEIKGTDFENGILKLEWEPFKGMNFEKYDVWKYVLHTPYAPFHVTTVTSQEQTSVGDYSYHGELSRYFVTVNESYTGSSYDVEGPLPEITASNTSDGNILLKWNIPPYFNALNGYKVSYLDNFNGNLIHLQTVEGAQTDSAKIENTLFGYDYNLYLTMNPTSNNYLDEWGLRQFLSSEVKASAGLPAPSFAYAQGGKENKIYLSDYSAVKIYNTEKHEIISSIEHTEGISGFNLSAGNRYLLSFLNKPDKLFLTDLQNDSQSKEINLSTNFTGISHRVSISDKGTGAFTIGQKVVLYDFINETVLAEAPLENNGLYSNKISSSGNMLVVETYGGREFFSYQNGQLKSLPNINEGWGVTFANFLPGEPEKLVLITGREIKVINTQTTGLFATWTIAGDEYFEAYHLDPKSQNLFIRLGENLILFDLKTGEKLQLAKTKNYSWSTKWDFIYNNNQVFWNKGKRMPVNTEIN